MPCDAQSYTASISHFCSVAPVVASVVLTFTLCAASMAEAIVEKPSAGSATVEAITSADLAEPDDAFDFYRPLGERDVGSDDDAADVEAAIEGGIGGDGFGSATADDMGSFTSAADTLNEDSSFFADFGSFQSCAPPVPEPPAPAPAMAASDVDVIKATMAALKIAPPPWVVKMQHIQRIRAMQGQLALSAAAAGADGAAAEPPAAAAAALLPNMEMQWEAEIRLRAPDAAHLLSGGAIAGAVPTIGGTDASPFGLPQPKKKVTGKQLVAERRKQREDEKKRAAAVAGPSHGASKLSQGGFKLSH